MESVTDPKLLEDRLFYKLGEFTYDRRHIVLAVGLVACFGMASMIELLQSEDMISIGSAVHPIKEYPIWGTVVIIL